MLALVILRPLADLNTAQSRHNLYEFFLWKNINFYFRNFYNCLLLWPPICVIEAWCPYWTIVLLVKQDITFKKEYMSLKLEPFSVSSFKMTIWCSDLALTAWENKRDGPFLVIMIVFAITAWVSPVCKPPNTFLDQFLPLGDHTHYCSIMLSNFI